MRTASRERDRSLTTRPSRRRVRTKRSRKHSFALPLRGRGKRDYEHETKNIPKAGIAAATAAYMKSPTAPHTYDEITRRTVPDPDSSFRPPIPSEVPDVFLLRARVIDALHSGGFFDVGFEVDGERVLLRGEVRDAATRTRIEQLVAMIDGVERVDSTLHDVSRPGS